MYLGAVLVAREVGNPEAIPQAAHSMRELMEKLPVYLDVPVERTGPSLGARARKFVEHIDVAKRNSKCHREAVWKGTIDPPLKRLLSRMEEFADGFRSDYPTRRENTRRMLRRLDPLRDPIPEGVEATLFEDWKNHDAYFKKVAHHGALPSPLEFGQAMASCGRFLLVWLRPPTFEIQSTLDALIDEAESNG